VITAGNVGAFCTDITQRLNEMNINLQEATHFINAMFGKIAAFEKKL